MNTKEILQQGSRELGVELNEQQVEQFMEYFRLLVEWNQKMNLTAIVEEQEVMIKHFLDCLSIGNKFDIGTVNSVVDVGTGAGFPGLPLKIAYPHIKLMLVDSLNKRIQFLNEVVKKLGLEQVECVHSRAEDIGQDKGYREKYDLCVSRAVAHLSVLTEYCLPLVKKGGKFIALKGPDMSQEIKEAEKAIGVLGGEIAVVELIQIPYSEINHSMVFIKKVRQTPTQYPRKSGKPSKNPII